MSYWIDPELLQLVGLGTKGDSHIADGRHLRWFFGRWLGFPRSGFRLRRSASPTTPARWKAIYTSGDVGRVQELTQAAIGPVRRRFATGLTVDKAGGLVFQAAGPASVPYLRLDTRPAWLDLGFEGPSATPPPPPLSVNPAAWVRLTIFRRVESGGVIATAFANGRGSWHFQDRAAIGHGLDAHVPATLRSAIRRTSRQDLLGPVTERVYRDREPWLRPDELRIPPWPRRNPWVADTLLLHGGLIERIELVGHDAVVARIEWLPSRAYAQAPVWTEVDRFYLPLTDQPAIYPAWTAQAGQEVAKNRLFAVPPRALAPWDTAAMPPPPAPPAEIAADLSQRYLGGGHHRMYAAMKGFLDHELATSEPQAMFIYDDAVATVPDDDDLGGGTIRLSPYDVLRGAALDPCVARLLGLMTTDAATDASPWDYAVDAGFPTRWLQRQLVGGLREAPRALVAALPHFDSLERSARAASNSQECVSLATHIAQEARPPLTPPLDPQVEIRPRPGARPIEAEVIASCRGHDSNLFEAQARVMFAVRRRSAAGDDVALHAKDDESGRRVPLVPTRAATTSGRVAVHDRSVPAYGTYTWRLSGMDLWGRWSPFADVSRSVVDHVPPPAPAALAAELVGAPELAPTWARLRVGFDWGDGAAAAAPDLARFELHLRQGAAGFADTDVPTLWGRLETAPGATTPPLIVAWPSGATVVPPGLTATTTMAHVISGGGGATRVTIELGPVVVPFDGRGRAQISATVRAVDVSGNASRLARCAIASRADLAPPPPPPAHGTLRYAPHADAQGRASVRIAFVVPPHGSVQVYRCPAAALLAAGQVDDAVFQTLDATARVDLLQGLAIQHRPSFRIDHAAPYVDTATHHDGELGGMDRGWTLFVVLAVSAHGIAEAWPVEPLRFEVVAVPALETPDVPRVVEARGGDRNATLRVAPDPSGRATELRLYRTRDAAAVDDVRRMRPTAVVAASASVVVLADSDLLADVDYYYRVVAVNADGVRSTPSSPVTIRATSSQPPETATVEEVSRPPDPSRRGVRVRLPRRDYTVTLLRRQRGVPGWSPANTPVTRADGSFDVAALPTVVDAGAYVVTTEDLVPAPAARWTYRVEIVDPRGRRSMSAVVEDSP